MAEETSSLVGIVETTVELKSSPEKLHDMLVGRPHDLSTASPSNIQGAELHEGEMGQVGAVIFWNYVHGKSTFTFLYLYINLYQKFIGFQIKINREEMKHPYVLYITLGSLSYFQCEISNNLKHINIYPNVKFGADGEAKVVKARTESIDPENNQVTYRVLDGDLMKEYKSFVITFQVTPKEGEPGSIAHWHFEYEKINEEVAHPETLLQFAVEVSKEMDEHILSEE